MPMTNEELNGATKALADLVELFEASKGDAVALEELAKKAFAAGAQSNALLQKYAHETGGELGRALVDSLMRSLVEKGTEPHRLRPGVEVVSVNVARTSEGTFVDVRLKGPL